MFKSQMTHQNRYQVLGGGSKSDIWHPQTHMVMHWCHVATAWVDKASILVASPEPCAAVS